MRGFRSFDQAKRFLTLHGLTQNLFRLGRHLMQAVNLIDIMRTFGLSNVGSVSFITTQIRMRSKENTGFSKALQRIKY